MFVYLDNVPFRKNYFQNRNLTPKGWLTVPVTRHLDTLIKDVQISDPDWSKSYWGKIYSYYKDSAYFAHYKDELQQCLQGTSLVDANYALIDFFRRNLDIKTKTKKASELETTTKNSDLVLEICKKVNADTYLSGLSGQKYLDFKKFNDAGVAIEWYKSPFDEDEWTALEFIMRMGDKLFNDPN